MKPNYIVIPLITVVVASVGSFLTSKGMEWYQSINTPSWTPSGFVISSVWTAIFILATISALIAWNRGKKDSRFWLIVSMFLVNGFLNVFWSYLFFYNGLIGPAVWEAGLLGLSVLFLIIFNWRVSRTASLLLLPYLIWVSFATYLTYQVFLLN